MSKPNYLGKFTKKFEKYYVEAGEMKEEWNYLGGRLCWNVFGDIFERNIS